MSDEPWTWTGPEAPPFTPQQFYNWGRLERAAELAGGGLDDLIGGLGPDPQEAAMTEPVFWYGLEATPAESAAADQVLAELGIDPGSEDFGPWDDGPAPQPPPDPRIADLARELTAGVAESGDIELAASMYGELGGAGRAIDLSSGYQDVIDLTNSQIDHARAVQADDAQHVPSRTEARLAHLLSRLGRGTYEPSSITLASPSTAARELARHRWGAAQPAALTGAGNCGASDEHGYCIEPYHSAGCGSAATPDVTEALAGSGAYARLAAQPFTDAPGRVWDDQYGQPMTLRGHVEAATGQRLGGSAAFETGTGPREVTTPAPWPMLRDPDDPDDPGRPLPDVSHYAAAMGITPQSAADARDRFTQRRTDAVVGALLGGRAVRAADTRWDVQARRDAIREQLPPVELRQVSEPWNGSLPQYGAG